MCGIHAVISQSPIPDLADSFKACLVSRGPDHFGRHKRQDVTISGINIALTSTVLSLRGDHVTPQPFYDEASGCLFCWNGEAWRFDGKPIAGNDGEFIFGKLVAADGLQPPNDVCSILRKIEGPLAFVFVSKASGLVLYGRDRLGRRSLLKNADHGLVLSSVADPASSGWAEVEADGIYAEKLNDYACPHNGTEANMAARVGYEAEGEQDEDMVLSIGNINMSIPEDGNTPPPLVFTSPPIQQLRHELTQSLKLRVLNVPSPGTDAGSSTRIAILFSGGLDCTVLARLASDLVPADQGIDLLNVAFENPRVAKHRDSDATGTIYEACPDRITGRKAFAELASVCPRRKWRFVTVDVPYSETIAHRPQVIALMHPHNTEMDLSIACALYFAARGVGAALTSPEGSPEPYKTPARVLLSGLGADELFGGYSRHQAAFEREGYAGLAAEIKLDVGRLGKRNLGRDDRVLAHWSREPRFPYLDERFVKWAIGLPVWEKCDFANPGNESLVEPGKRILRLLAEELGMSGVAREKKRAIQFGSRTAKMESGKTKGTTLIAASS